MDPVPADRDCFFQVWIVRSERWGSEAGSQAPPQGALVRLIGIWASAELAAAWVEGFNQEVQEVSSRGKSGLWAVATPIERQVEGEFSSRRSMESLTDALPSNELGLE